MRKIIVPAVSFALGVLVTVAFLHDREFRQPGKVEFTESNSPPPYAPSRAESATREPGSSAAQNESDRPTAGNVSPKPAANNVQDLDHGGRAESYEPADAYESSPASRPSAITSGDNRQNSATARHPIPVAEEIAPFFKDGSSVSNFQSKMESEDRDDSWAQFMEAQIAAYLASKPTLAAFQIALIQCRSSMCEIQAVGYGPDAAATWFTAVNDLPRQPWAVEFGDGNFKMRQFAPDVTSILMQMARVKSDSTVDAANVLADRR